MPRKLSIPRKLINKPPNEPLLSHLLYTVLQTPTRLSKERLNTLRQGHYTPHTYRLVRGEAHQVVDEFEALPPSKLKTLLHDIIIEIDELHLNPSTPNNKHQTSDRMDQDLITHILRQLPTTFQELQHTTTTTAKKLRRYITYMHNAQLLNKKVTGFGKGRTTVLTSTADKEQELEVTDNNTIAPPTLPGIKEQANTLIEAGIKHLYQDYNPTTQQKAVLDKYSPGWHHGNNISLELELPNIPDQLIQELIRQKGKEWCHINIGLFDEEIHEQRLRAVGL